MAEKKSPKAGAKAPVAKAKTAAPKTLAELREEVKSLEGEILEHKRSHRQGELVNPHILTVKRKSIARLLTAIRKEELSAKETN